MSLVAYASSGDESDESDETPVTISADVIINKEPRATPADEEESHEHQKPASATGDAGQISDSDSEGEQHTENSSSISHTQEPDIGSLLKGLPEPKAYDETATPDKNQKVEDDLEEEVKPKLSQIKDAPKPPPKRAKVRITIPALQNDPEEEERVAKKPKLSASNVKSGLTALLPAPVHAATKETNRILLPYSLKKPQEKKRPEPSKTDKVASDPQPKFQGLSSYGRDSDSDEADSAAINFFSLGGSESSAAGPVLPEPFPMQKTSKLSLPPPKMSQKDNSETIDLKSVSDTTESEVTSTADEGLVNTEQSATASPSAASSMSGQDEPLSFKSGNWNTMSAAPYHLPYGGYGSDSVPMATEMAGPQMDYVQYEAGPQYSQNFEKDAEFLKMQGKKQRGKEEIKIVDVNADDFISAVDIQKSMSEETKGEYAAHRKKDGPTSQQKRKHQITYLAHQAKETELELKNQWSMNRMTKRQTQAKYGF